MAREERQQTLALRILETCRAELCEMFPYFDTAFAFLNWQLHGEELFAVDGKNLHFSVPGLLRLYSQEPAAVRRGYLHMLLHCLFLHLFRPGDVDGGLWDLACDMAVEQLIEQEAQPRLAQENAVRRDCLARMGEKALSAEQIVRLLKEEFFPYSLPELQAAFAFDDHSGWAAIPRDGVRSHWEQMLLDAAQNKAGKGKRGTTPGSLTEEPQEIMDPKYDYRKFLRRFTFPREEVELDTESFDYIFYNFGMTHYGSMPLIEPLEYKEVRRLEELVIAIDTSSSCSAEVVSRFLSETYAILSRQENFFRRMKVYFIQCDCVIQDVALIQSREEWLDYAKKIQIRGRSGTDFTPVFDYVETLRQKKELKNLKALLYFTDGDGAYPTKPPDYETAFILLKDSGHPELIPRWGRLLLI